MLSGSMKCEFAEFEDGVSTVQANLIVQDQLSSLTNVLENELKKL